MSKRTEMFARIAAAMPEDAEVQEWKVLCQDRRAS